MLPSNLANSVGTPNSLISRLNSPACTCPFQRFADALTNAGAWLGSSWIANPSMQSSHISFLMPVYPGALAIQNSLYHQADESRIGSASGLLRTSMYLGAILAAATTGATFHDGADTAGLRQLAYYMVAAALVFLFITVADRSLKRVGAKS
jgi:hypothetical protein